MGYVTSTVDLNLPGINSVDEKSVRALHLTVDALKTDVTQRQVMPFRSGRMQGSVFVDDTSLTSGECSLMTEGPYARRLYYHPEYNFRTAENPNAKGRWLDDYLKGGIRENFIPDAFAEFLGGTV